MKAEYDNGVLEISVPRAAGTNAKPLAKEIPVKSPVKSPKAIKA
ncbi:MAG: hypothetical protein ACXVBB_22850 [Isosphaeraceae bacterium]